MAKKIKASVLVGAGVIVVAVLVTLFVSGEPQYFCEVKPELGVIECPNDLKACDESGEICQRCYHNESNSRSYVYCKTGWLEVIDDTVPKPKPTGEVSVIEYECNIYGKCPLK